MSSDPDRPGRLIDGFNVIARDLDRAFAVARFLPLQMLLIEQARELSWTASKKDGSEEPKPFKLNVSALSRVANCERSWLSKQVKQLVKDRVFLDLGNGELLINKDFRKWLGEKGEERLTMDQVAWCGEVRRKKRVVSNCVAHDTPPVSSTTHPLCSARHTPCVVYDTPPVSSTTHPEVSPLRTPIEDRAPREFLEREERVFREGESPYPLLTDSSPSLSPEDLACIQQAERLLSSDLRTEAIALELGRTRSLPGSIGIAGWKWLRAAQRILSPELPDSKRKWSYFVGIARNLTDADREERPAATAETKAQRKQRELQEGFRALAAKRRAEREESATDGR